MRDFLFFKLQQVRRECNLLAGWLSTRECDKKQVHALEDLEVQKRKLQRKVP